MAWTVAPALEPSGSLVRPIAAEVAVSALAMGRLATV